MKMYAVAASLAAGLSMLSGAAFAQVGTVGVTYSHTNGDSNPSGPPDLETSGINGSIAIQTSSNMAVLLDAAYSSNDVDIAFSSADTSLLSGSAHLIVRNDDMAYGGFVGFGQLDPGPFGGGDQNILGIGGEYAKFFSNSTLVLSGGYITNSETDAEAWGLTGEYRFFASDNLRFDAFGGWADTKAAFSSEDATYIGLGAEWRPSGWPASIGAFAKYQDLAQVGSVDVIGATLRFDFGTTSLKERDRKGNTFGNFGGLLNFLQ